jgi:hypothetical protein
MDRTPRKPQLFPTKRKALDQCEQDLRLARDALVALREGGIVVTDGVAIDEAEATLRLVAERLASLALDTQRVILLDQLRRQRKLVDLLIKTGQHSKRIRRFEAQWRRFEELVNACLQVYVELNSERRALEVELNSIRRAIDQAGGGDA